MGMLLHRHFEEREQPKAEPAPEVKPEAEEAEKPKSTKRRKAAEK